MKKYWIISIVLFAGLFFFLRLVFLGKLILPQTFHIGNLAIHYYGLIMALAAASGFYLAMKRAPRFGIGQKQAEDILFWVIIGGFIGARLYHILSSIGYYWQNPLDVFKVWNGGLSIYGAVLGGIITLIIWQKIKNRGKQVSRVTLDTLDWLAPSVVLGQIIGRMGNLFNYEAFGYPTNLPWRMFVPLNFRPVGYIKFNFFHPFFLYELLGNALILLLLIKIFEPRQNKNYGGELVFWYLLLYNSLRFVLEFLRIDSTFIGFVRLNAAMSLLLALLSLAGLLYVRKFFKTS